MLRPLPAVLAVALLVPAAAHPQTTPVIATANTPYVFEAVDSFEVRGSLPRVVVTGLQVGGAVSTSIAFPYTLSTSTSETNRSFERCDRLALVAMNKPGQFLLEVRMEGGSPYYLACKLTRR